MADEYSKYKLFRLYKTEDGVNYTPLDEYQALYESGDGVDCSCGYRKYKWDSGNDTKSTIINSDTDRTIPMQTFRIDATYPNNSGNYFIRFTTTPDTDTTSNKGFSICPDEGTIWDNGTKQYITAQTKIYDNVYEYTFSVPVYFSNGEVNAPYEQVTAVTYNCEYMCGSVIIGNIPTLTINRVQGNWTREGNTFTSNTINHNENTIERIYFSVSSPTAVTFTIDQSSENRYDFLIISKLDSGVTNSTSTDSSSPNYAHWYNGRTGSISMQISDTEEHFVELMYQKDDSGSSGRDNVIVTLEIKLDYDILSEYEVWREYEYCPNDDTIESLPTGNIEYRNPKQSCKCGYREYEYRDSGELINGEDIPDSWFALSEEYPGGWASFKYVRIDTNNYSFIPSDEINDDYVYFYIDDYSSYKRRYGISISEGKLYDNGYEINIKDLKEIEEGVYEYSFSTSLMFYMGGKKEDEPIYYNKRNNLALKHIYCNSNAGNYHSIYSIYMKQYEYEFCPSDSSYDKKTGNEQLNYYGDNKKYCIDTKGFLSSTTGTYADYEVENGVYVTYYSGHTKSSSSSSSRKIEGDFIDTINTDAYQGYFYINFKTKTNKIVFTNIDGGDSKQYSNYSYIFVDGVKIMSYYLKQFVVYLEGDENTIHKIECGQSGSYNMGKWMFNAVREGYNYQMDVFSYKDCNGEIIEMGKNYKEIV